jgi:hypothetical protein
MDEQIDLAEAAENARRLVARFLSNPTKGNLSAAIQELEGYKADSDSLTDAVGSVAMESQNPSGAIAA